MRCTAASRFSRSALLARTCQALFRLGCVHLQYWYRYNQPHRFYIDLVKNHARSAALTCALCGQPVLWIADQFEFE